jgi:hypothetical protein
LSQERDSCCNGVIYLTIKDGENRAVQGVYVKLWKDNTIVKTLTTGDDGRVIFRELCKGKYGISFSKDGYKGQEFSIELECNDTLEFNKTILASEQDSCCNGRIKIYAKDKNTGEYIRYGTVKILKDNQVVAGKALENGYAVFERLCQGRYTIKIISETHKTIEFVVELGCNENKEIVKEMESNETRDSCCNGKIIIYLKDKNTGQLVNYATVKLWKGSQVVSSKTPTNGKVIFDGLCEGKYGVDVISDKYKSIEFVLELGCNETKETTQYIELISSNDTCETAKLKLKIVNGEEQPIEGATIVIENSRGESKEATTNSEGWGVIEGLLAPMDYTITISKDGYTTKTITRRFGECKTYSETVKLLME